MKYLFKSHFKENLLPFLALLLMNWYNVNSDLTNKFWCPIMSKTEQMDLCFLLSLQNIAYGCWTDIFKWIKRNADISSDSDH